MPQAEQILECLLPVLFLLGLMLTYAGSLLVIVFSPKATTDSSVVAAVAPCHFVECKRESRS